MVIEILIISDDGWIDDSDAPDLGQSKSIQAPAWEYGWFAWKGDVNALFKQGSKGKVIDDTPVVSTAHAVVEKVKSSASPSKKKKKEDAITVNPEVSETEQHEKTKKELTKKPPSTSNFSTKSIKKHVKSSTESSATPKKKYPVRGEQVIEYKPVGLAPIPPPLIKELDKLQKETKKCDFTVKKNFPSSLKPIFNDCVTCAMDHQILNADFWAHITNILPYNSFTMKKLATRQVYPDRMANLNKEIPQAYKEFESELSRALEDQAKELQEGKKFRFDEKIRIIFWNILCLEWEIAEMDNEIKRLEKQPPSFMEAAVRKAVYSKMAGYWPAGMMETSVLSTQYSQFKKKREKSEDEHGFQYPEVTPQGLIRVDPYSRIVPKPRTKREDSIIILDSPEKSGAGEKRKQSEAEDAGVAAKKSKV